MDKLKATLRCHTHVGISVHRGTAATSTTPGLILPVLGWILDRRMGIRHSRPILLLTVFTNAQSPVESVLLRPLPHQLLMRQTELFFLIMNEVKDDMK